MGSPSGRAISSCPVTSYGPLGCGVMRTTVNGDLLWVRIAAGGNPRYSGLTYRSRRSNPLSIGIHQTGLPGPITSGMRLKPSSYLILGMVNRNVRTGYAIKRAVDLKHPLLLGGVAGTGLSRARRPRERRLPRRAPTRHTGKRPRKVVAASPRRAGWALDEWLRSERDAHLEFRDEGLLRVFFADSLPPEEALELVRAPGAAQAEELEASSSAPTSCHSRSASTGRVHPGRRPRGRRLLHLAFGMVPAVRERARGSGSRLGD